MKYHLKKEECFKRSGLPQSMKEAFFKGWYAAGNEINQGEDSDFLQERLYENDFLKREEIDNDD